MTKAKLSRDAYLTTSEAAKVMNVCLRTIQLWCEKGQLPYTTTLGGHKRIFKQDLYRIKQEHSSLFGKKESLFNENEPLFTNDSETANRVKNTDTIPVCGFTYSHLIFDNPEYLVLFQYRGFFILQTRIEVEYRTCSIACGPRKEFILENKLPSINDAMRKIDGITHVVNGEINHRVVFERTNPFSGISTRIIKFKPSSMEERTLADGDDFIYNMVKYSTKENGAMRFIPGHRFYRLKDINKMMNDFIREVSN